MTDAGSNTPVTVRTLFQAGSISKPVAATGALSLVEAGKLSLDQDVNQTLKTWKVPENEFTKTEKVTLRRLMSHTAGLTIHGFPGYDVGAPLPTVAQVLDGEKPANTAPVRVDTVPGTTERYSGGGVTIEQQLMIDVTGQPFPEFMKENVLDRIGMTDSSYSQPLTGGWAARTAAGTYQDGKSVHGRWHVYPEMAAAGLWTTPTDLAKFAIEIALSRRGKANHVLSEQMTKTMFMPSWTKQALRVPRPEESRPVRAQRRRRRLSGVAHHERRYRQGGSHHGELRQWNCRRGFVVQAVAREYDWNYKSGSETFATLLLLAKARGPAAALDRYTELKKTGGADADIDEGTLNGLGYTLLRDGHTRDAIAVSSAT